MLTESQNRGAGLHPCCGYSGVMTIKLEDVYPDASEEQLKDAEERIEGFVQIVFEAYAKHQQQRVDGVDFEAYDEDGRPITNL